MAARDGGYHHMDAVVARRMAAGGVAEQHLKYKVYSQPNVQERVRILGVTDRRDLNGRHGMAGPVQPRNGGRRLVVLEGGGGASVSLLPANLELAPPAPENVIYNQGTGGYQQQQHVRKCRPGSGKPAYSMNKAPVSGPIAAPISGALLPRHNPPVDFSEAFRDGHLPVRVAGAAESGELRWLDPLTGAEVPRHQVDARKWLPLLLDGLRDAAPGAAYVALRGAIELAGTSSRRGTLPPLMPAAVPALKAAFDLRERSVMCAALRLLTLVLRSDPRCGRALRPHYKQLLPALAAFKVVGRQPDLADEIEYSQHRAINVLDLIDEALEVMEANGGPGAGDLIKNYVPSWQPSSVELHRGFR